MIVADTLVVEIRGGRRIAAKLFGHHGHCGIERRAATQPIDSAEASGRHQPRARIGRHPVKRPSLDGCRKRVVQRLLGEVEITEEADERGKDTP